MTLEYIMKKYSLSIDQKMPIEIPNVGRDDLAHLFSELGFLEGAEIGVEQGAYSETLCKSNSDLHLSCIDPWLAYSGYRDHVSQAKLDRFFQIARGRLAFCNATFYRQFSIDAVKDFKNNSLDFVYIDGNHDLLNVITDIRNWSEKVRDGGIISGHDYIRHTRQQYSHVVEAVHSYTMAYHITPWFVLGTKGIIASQIRDRPRSWMWVKQ